MNIVIFGTGLSAEAFIKQINMDQTNIVAFLDNNKEKQGKLMKNLPIYSPLAVAQLHYDFIVIASQFVTEIYDQLVSLGVPNDKIIPLHKESLLNRQREYYKGILKKMTSKNIRNKNKIDISLVSLHNSGCNSHALYKFTPNDMKQKYNITYHLNNELNSEPSDVVVTTHRNVVNSEGKLNIELWHGFPFKSVYRMNQNRNTEEVGDFENFKDATAIASYSPLGSTLNNACYPTTIDQYYVTGSPRNDYLFHSNGKDKLRELIDGTGGQFLACYMPTFRMRNTYAKNELIEGKVPWNTLFDFPDFNEGKLFDFLEENQIVLVVKMHTAEESKFTDSVSSMLGTRVKLLTNQRLEEEGIELYELLNGFDALITDYSSVYFDYLLLERPIIFTPTDLEEYQKSRGFLLEPYEYWTPGHKAVTLEQFMDALREAKHDPQAYRKERKMVRDLAHTFQDGNSSRRVWDMIDSVIQKEWAIN